MWYAGDEDNSDDITSGLPEEIEADEDSLEDDEDDIDEFPETINDDSENEPLKD